MRLARNHFYSRCALFVGIAIFFLNDQASAQFTSSYSTISVAGNFNGFNSNANNMVLVSNGVWQAYLRLNLQPAQMFRFSTPNFTATWQQNTQTNFATPLYGTAELNSGSDIVLTGGASRVLRFTFDENSRDYSVLDVSHGSGSNFPSIEPWINELHYDNAGSDTNEFVEIAGQAGTDMSSYQIMLYNGGNGSAYRTSVLTETIPNQLNGFGALGVAYPANAIQNGSPDGVALVKNATQLIQFVSYEGVFLGVGGPANGILSTEIGAEENGLAPSEYSLQLEGVGMAYGDFAWAAPSPNTFGVINHGQDFGTLPVASRVDVKNLGPYPTAPSSSDGVDIGMDVEEFDGASNVSAVIFYRAGLIGPFQPLAMTNYGAHYETSEEIPPQPIGSVVQYYAFVNFAGLGTNSPTRMPVSAPLSVNSYGISIVSPYTVWINEVNLGADATSNSETNEYIEIVGLAGADISGWTVSVFNGDESEPAMAIRIPPRSVLPNNESGFGFYLVGDSNVPTVRLVFTNSPAQDDQLMQPGAVMLRDEYGGVQDFVRYGSTSVGFTNLPTGSRYIGYDQLDTGDQGFTLALIGSGSNAAAFMSASNSLYTPGFVNSGQTILGGNTNPLQPLIRCPNDIKYTSVDALVPLPNTESVWATGLCGNLSASVSFIGDVTNSGTGYRANPKIITRTYEAISDCSTTSRCNQAFIIEDRSAFVNPATTRVRIVTANLTSGYNQKYEAPGLNILKGLRPDIAAIQEFNYGPSSNIDARAMVDEVFGPLFYYYREPWRGLNPIPNGIASRWPIVDAGYWADALPNINQRGFAWARIDIHGRDDVYVVSLHLKASSGSANAQQRAAEVAQLKSLIASNFPPDALIVVAGDFNLHSTNEVAWTNITATFSEGPRVSRSDGTPLTYVIYDHILTSFNMTSMLVDVAMPSQVFTNGLVFNSALYTPLSDVEPVAYGDSGALNMQHDAVVKEFMIVHAAETNVDVTVPPSFVIQPANIMVEQSESANLSVAVEGSEPLIYRWKRNNYYLAGATGAVLHFGSVQPANLGIYNAVAANAAGIVTSIAASLDMNVPIPDITWGLTNGIVWQGLSNLSYTVQVRTNMGAGEWFSIGTGRSSSTYVTFTNLPSINDALFMRVVYP